MVVAWLKVIGLGLTKIPMKLAALFVVPFLNDEQRFDHPIFGVQDATDLSYWNIAVRNGVHNMYTKPMPMFWTKGDSDMEASGLKHRLRVSTDGEYVSFRMTWGKSRPEGKREFYIGWTMNERDYMRLTFFQLRIF